MIEVVDADGNVTSAADFTGVSLLELPASVDGFTVLESEGDGFVCELSQASTETNTLLRIQFKSSVLRIGTRFGAQAFNADDPLFGQPVAAGNAFDFGEGDADVGTIGSLEAGNLFVEVPVVKGLLVNVRAVPAVVTPNNDDRSDTAQITYDITNIARPTDVEIKIFDLSGRLVRFDRATQSSGRYSWPWDGLDQSNMLVPPGNYIFSVTLSAGTGDERGVGVGSVAY